MTIEKKVKNHQINCVGVGPARTYWLTLGVGVGPARTYWLTLGVGVGPARTYLLTLADAGTIAIRACSVALYRPSTPLADIGTLGNLLN